MAIYKEDIVAVELNSGTIHRSFLNRSIGSGDNMANRFGVRLFRDGEEVSAESSTVTGVFMAPSGTNYVISETSYTGSTGTDGNVAYVQLPEICYAVAGQFCLAIKLSGGGVEGTMRIVDGVVSETGETGAVVPTSTIPTTEEIIEAYEEAIAVIGGSVRFDASQTLSASEKETARANIGSASTQELTAVETELQGNITEVETELHDISGNTGIKLIAGKYIDLSGSSISIVNNEPALSGNSSAGYAVGYMACSAGDIFSVNGHGGSQTRLWGFVNSSGTILSVASANADGNNKIVKAPSGSAWIIVHTNNGKISYKGRMLGVTVDDLYEENVIDILEYMPRTNVTGTVDFTWSGNVCTVDGEQPSTGNAWDFFWVYTDPMPDKIKPGKQYMIHFEQGANSKVALGFVWLYSDTSKTYEYYYSDTVITVPSTAVGVSIALVVRAGVTVSNVKVECSLLTMSEPDKLNNRMIDDISDAMGDILPHNILPIFGKFRNNGTLVTYTWAEDKETCTVNGTSEEITSNFIWMYTDGLPEEIKPGDTFNIQFTSTDESAVGVHFYYKHLDESVTNERFTNDASITIPNDCIGISIRLDVTAGTVCNNVVVKLKMMTISNTSATGGVANHVSRMLSMGSSFMTGAIYPNGQFDHLCSFDNSPYGNVAIGLGIEQKNVTHILVSSAGLLYDAGNGNILSKLKAMDLSPYDYVLTQYNRPDLGMGVNPGFELGDMESTAGDGTIVGAVLDLLAYMKTSNPSATLIMVGAPPSSTQDASAYDNVFTALYNNGVSIGEADLMLHRLAVREHFIFIDWEDLNLSYYYKDFCYPGNVHCQTDAPVRAMGMYLARQCNYTTSLAKVLKADSEG